MPLSPEAEDALIDRIIHRLFEKLEEADREERGEDEELEHQPHPDESEDYAEPERYADAAPDGGSVPSGSNTFVPGRVRAKNDEEMEKYCMEKMNKDSYAPEPEPVRERMARINRVQCGQEVERYRRQTETLSKQLEQAQTRIAQLERYARTASRERDLTGLMAEGYEFDLAEELADVADLPEKPYLRHLEKIRTRYSRSAEGQPFVPVAGDSEIEPKNPKGDVSPEEMSQVIRYAQKNKLHGLDGFQEALVRYRREQGNGTA